MTHINARAKKTLSADEMLGRENRLFLTFLFLYFALAASASASSAPLKPKDSDEIVRTEKLDGLLTVIVTWLSENADLPAVYDHPNVRFLSTSEITRIHKTVPETKIWHQKSSRAASDGGNRQIVSAYSTISRTIFLPEDWAGVSPEEISILVHEMTHHLQTVGAIKYECAAAREVLAYDAQERSLNYFGTSLQDEFDIDDMTLLLLTKCKKH